DSHRTLSRMCRYSWTAAGGLGKCLFFHLDALPIAASRMTSATTQTTVTPEFLQRLAQIVGPEGSLTGRDELLVYECDGYTIEKTSPEVVVFPTTTEQVVAIVRLCNEFQVPFVPRGAGTSLAGGCLPIGGGVMIALTRMRKILEVNLRDRYAIV